MAQPARIRGQHLPSLASPSALAAPGAAPRRELPSGARWSRGNFGTRRSPAASHGLHPKLFPRHPLDLPEDLGFCSPAGGGTQPLLEKREFVPRSRAGPGTASRGCGDTSGPGWRPARPAPTACSRRWHGPSRSLSPSLCSLRSARPREREMCPVLPQNIPKCTCGRGRGRDKRQERLRQRGEQGPGQEGPDLGRGERERPQQGQRWGLGAQIPSSRALGSLEGPQEGLGWREP